jgi:hypothetical protein
LLYYIHLHVRAFYFHVVHVNTQHGGFVPARAVKDTDTSGDIGNYTSNSIALSIYQAPVAAATTHDVVVKLTHKRAHFSCWNEDQDSSVHAADIYSINENDDQNGDHSNDIEMIVNNITEVRKSTLDHMVDYCLAWQRKRLHKRTVVASYVPIYQLATLPVSHSSIKPVLKPISYDDM